MTQEGNRPKLRSSFLGHLQLSPPQPPKGGPGLAAHPYSHSPISTSIKQEIQRRKSKRYDCHASLAISPGHKTAWTNGVSWISRVITGDAGDRTKGAPVTLSLWNFGRSVMQKHSQLLCPWPAAEAVQKSLWPAQRPGSCRTIQTDIPISYNPFHLGHVASFHPSYVHWKFLVQVGVSFQVSDPESIQKPLIRPAYLRATWDKPQPTKPSQMNALITPTRLQNRKNKDAQSKKAKKWETWNSLHVSAVSEVSGSLVPMPNWSLVEKQPTVDSVLISTKCSSTASKKEKTRQCLSKKTCFHTKFGNLACIIISASISGGSGGGGIDLMPDLPWVLQNVTVFINFFRPHCMSHVPLQLRLDYQVLRLSKPSVQIH